MAKRSREEREAIAQRRILNILRRHVVANARTLEQKISDAGPSPQRVDPHILSPVRQALTDEGVLRRIKINNSNWYRLSSTPDDIVNSRLAILRPIWEAMCERSLSMRIGQALEIATFRALQGLPSSAPFFGCYVDLDEHDDSTLYDKEEPPRHIGNRRTRGKKCLDFLVEHPSAGYLGLECKNVREWLYPQQTEIRETIEKCLALNCVPVIIARRIPYVTFRLLWACGCIIHQTFNQLLPVSALEVADKARHKDLLGYHDIRMGNVPDSRLTVFIQNNMLQKALEARQRFDAYKDLLADFVSRDISYQAFAAKVRRRENGLNEDFDQPESDYNPFDDWDM